MLVAASSPLTQVIPGLMIWTVVFFLIVFVALKKLAFGRIQALIDERRESIRRASEAEAILAEARRTREAMEQRMREETEAERQRRLEETRREIAAETARALQQIRAEVADLTLEAASRVVGRALDPERDRALIEEAIAGLDFSRLEEPV